MTKPHIVCVVLDTLRYGHSASMAYQRNTTPFLDKKTEHGWRFRNLYANGPWTAPSHGSLFTGLDPIQHGVHHPQLLLHPEVPTLAETLGNAGYFCAAFSNNPWVGQRTGLQRGFDYFDNTWQTWMAKSFSQKIWRAAQRLCLSTDKGARLVQQRLAKLLRTRPQDQPLFLFINFLDIHPVCNPPLSYCRRFEGEYYHPHWMQTFAKGYYNLAYHYSGQWTLTDKQWHNFIWLYDAAIAYLDDQVRLLHERLVQILGENIVFIILSDHGDSFGEHGHISHIFSLYQNLLHVPGWAFGKPLGKGKEIQGALQLSDLFYGMCDLADVTPPRQARLSWETGDRDNTRLFFDYGYPEAQLSNLRRTLPVEDFSELERAIYGLYQHPYKYIAYFNEKTKTIHPDEELLFNLQEDPNEEINLATRNADVVLNLRQRFQEHLSQKTESSKIATAEDDEVIEQRLRDLGYI